MPVADVIDGQLPLAFDYRRIVDDAARHAIERLEIGDLATAFVGPTFTLSELKGVYEEVWGEPPDAANFRRSRSPRSTLADGERRGATRRDIGDETKPPLRHDRFGQPVAHAYSFRPVVAEVWLGVRLDPAMEHVGEPCRLRSAAREVPLQHDDQHEVALVGEVGDVLRDHRTPLATCLLRDLCVVGGPHPDLGDVDRISAVPLAEDLGGSGREHLVDEQTDHWGYASRAWRCSAASRLRSSVLWLRSMRRSISSRCSAAYSIARRISRGWRSVSSASAAMRSSS